jgi:hypothetical protein
LFLEWVSPSGFPVLNRYHKPEEPKTIELKTYGVRVRHNLALEFKDEPWATKTIRRLRQTLSTLWTARTWCRS